MNLYLGKKNITLIVLVLLISGISTGAPPVGDISQLVDYSPDANQTNNMGLVQEDSVLISRPNTELFGLDFFNRMPGSKFELSGGVVTPDYPLGPGDFLGIYLGGKAQQQFQVRVSADGKIYIPTVGMFEVNGQSLLNFQSSLDSRLQKLYNNYIIDVVLINPKQVRVSIVGEVASPGNFTLNALNTALDAVFIAGGPTELGSLRNIQIIRDDSLLSFIDLYEFLLMQKSPPNMYLQNGDRLYVPVRKRVVSIDGQVHRSKMYELSDQKKETIADIIGLAGGFTDEAIKNRVELSRQDKQGNRSLTYLDLEFESETGQTTIMQNNDKVFVYSVKDTIYPRFVHVFGQVEKPGDYEYEDNMRVSDLVLKAGGLVREAYLNEAFIAKVDPKLSFTPKKINLQGILDGTKPEDDILLEPDDQLFIRKIPEWELGPVVKVMGEVQFPGTYPIVKDSTTLSEIIAAAGGFTPDANISEASLTRSHTISVEDKEYLRLQNMTRTEMTEHEYQYFVMKQNTTDMKNIVVDFYQLLVNDKKEHDVILEPMDIINVPEKPRVVWVTGRVANSGGILYKEGASLYYYINQAGGYSWDSDPGDTKVIKVTGEIVKKNKVKSFSPGDRIWVPRKPERDYWAIFRDIVLVAGQLATVYLVIDRASN